MTEPNRYDAELRVALDATRHATHDILDRYAAFTSIPDAPASISTEADRAAQEIVLQTIRRAFPNDALCAEEATPTLAGAARTGERLWVVDPIDGTRGFARKNGEFSVMVAFVEAGRIAVGVVAEPARERLTWAVYGGGCWRSDAGGEPLPCRVRAVDALAAATLVQSRPRHADPPTFPVRVLKPARVIETYSAGIKLAIVARGEADVYANTYDAFSDWDICAGHLLVEEAGGRVTGLSGQELRYGLPGARQTDGLLATNALLHVAAVEELRRGR